MNSCIYEGWVRHRRLLPRSHEFSYRLFLMYLDLAELDAVFSGRWLWSTRRFALARFHREDHIGDPQVPLDVSVRDLVARRTGHRPQGPIRLLTHLRYWGYGFNPISIYYCFGPTDGDVQALVAEVSNTPWGERHCYVLQPASQSGGPPCNRFAKAMHVSPFMPMDVDYVWRSNRPGERLGVHMDVVKAGEKLFDATLGLRRRALDARALARMLVRYPFMTFKVITAIHWEALRLWLKRVPLYAHPAREDCNPAEGQQ